jgi:hypothetical protein
MQIIDELLGKGPDDGRFYAYGREYRVPGGKLKAENVRWGEFGKRHGGKEERG